MSTVGLVLAAGAGRRMGGPKALVRPVPGGETLLEVAVGRVRDAGCDEVLVVVGAAAEQVEPLARSTGAAVVVTTAWDEGMGASLRAGLRELEAAHPEAAMALVTLVDLPDVTSAVMVRVLAAGTDGAAALARASYAGVPGHPVVLGRNHWAGVRALATGDRGARDYLAATEHVLVECGDLATGRDADVPADLG